MQSPYSVLIIFYSHLDHTVFVQHAQPIARRCRSDTNTGYCTPVCPPQGTPVSPPQVTPTLCPVTMIFYLEIYVNIQTHLIHQRKPRLTIIKTNLLLLYRAILAVYSKKCASIAGRDIRCTLSQNRQTKSQSQPAFCTMVTIRCFLWAKAAGASYPSY